MHCLANIGSVQTFSIRHRKTLVYFTQKTASNTLLTSNRSFFLHQLLAFIKHHKQGYHLSSQVTPLPHYWHMLWSWPIGRTGLEQGKLPQHSAGLYHRTGDSTVYGSRLLWKGSGVDSPWAEADGLSGLSILYKHHLLPTMCQLGE